MAIEDAVSLAILLPMGTTVNDIPRRLELYETARRPRVELTLYYTALNARNEDEQSTDTETGKYSDVSDKAQADSTAAEMAKIMGTIGSHNEVVHSTAVLQEAQSAVGAAASDFPDSDKGEAIVG